MADYSRTQWYDQVADQNGDIIQAGTPLSATNMNRMESGIDLADNVIGVMATEALQKIGAINKELEKFGRPLQKPFTLHLSLGIPCVYRGAEGEGYTSTLQHPSKT